MAERRTRDWKVPGSSPCRNSGKIFFSRVKFLCWLLFRYSVRPRITAVALKRSRPFCQNGALRWQVTAKHTCILRTWLRKRDTVNWCIIVGLHITCAETATVSRGTSHVTTKQQRYKCNHFGGYSKRCVKLQSLIQSLTTRALWVCSEAENS